ncbi:Putative Ig domain-containing protein [Halpernia humi]|uniref:Putative Ig domain-containing protein n=1 Tax=Halpernia humi TaxID=493375 RepID=A0A1H6APR8_9FLAO|nr:Ig domain-containing protein [Halpernia humi]SEG50521.1 Putative Ig domain-containing protein [Halpernia humi]
MKKNLYSDKGLYRLLMPINKGKKPFYKFFLLLFFTLSSAGVFGQITVSYSFTGGSTSGTVDSNISFITDKGNSANPPAIFSNQLRLYQNATKGGIIIITPINGAVISSVVVHASGTTGPAGYTADGVFVSNLAASTTYTMSGLSATSQVEFYQRDANSANRIYVDSFSVTYSIPATGKTSNGSGNWNTASTWLPSGVPTATDIVTIRPQDIVYNDVAGLQRKAATNVNGGFRVEQGSSVDSSVSGAVNFTYGAAGTLIFNNSSGTYGVNNSDTYWPVTDGPVNVTVINDGGITLNAARTVNGNFNTSSYIFNINNITIGTNGTLQLNSGYGFSGSVGPKYGSNSLLKYNSGGTPGRNVEWNQSSGTIGTTAGYPNNVQISNNTTLNFPNGSSGSFKANGNLVIDAGSSLYQDYGGSAGLIVGGNLNLNGILKLGNAFGGDFTLGGNWTNSGTFTSNNRAVFFNGTSNQTITGATTFDYLTINNSAGVTLANNVTNNKTLDFTNGKITLGANNLTIGNTGTIINFSNSKYIVTNGTGQLKQNVAASSVNFPVGPSASLYNPISVTNSGTSDVYGFRVSQGVADASDINLMVNDSWYVSEAVSGGGNLRVSPQWNAADEGSNFSAVTGDNFIELYSPSITSFPASVSGQSAALTNSGDNFTNTLSGTQYFSVSKRSAPVINSLLTATAYQTVAFTYNITATNSPTSFTATGLPTGLTVDTTTGIISGATSAAVGDYNVTITATNSRGTDSKILVITVAASPCFYEDFSSITSGSSTSTGGSGTVWGGNTNFPTNTKAYEAGGAVRLGSGSGIGSITSTALSGVSGNVVVSIDVKGWTTVEGDLKVTLNGVSQTAAYSATISDAFETKSFSFTSVPAGSTLEIETTTKRAFIDNVKISCTPIVKKYYKSRGTGGNWNSASSWDSSTDNITFTASTDVPTKDNANSIIIQNGQKITINSSGVSMTETTVQSGGTLEITTTDSFDLSGSNDKELIIEDGGSFLVNSAGTFTKPTGNAYALVKTGGKLIAGPNMTSGTSFSNAYLGRIEGLFYFGDQSICEWSCPNTVLGSSSPTDSDFFFPENVGDMPIFRISTLPMYPFGSSIDNIFYAVLEANANFSLTGSGSKTFNGGIKGTATVTQNSGSGKLILGDGSNIPVIGGSVTLNVLNTGLQLPNGAEVPIDANVLITSSAENNSINRQGGNLTVDGTLDITNMRITNTSTGGVVVNGTLRTANSGGLYGTGSAIVDGNLDLNNGSTIEYYATVNQEISSAPNYYNITFSGAGIKTTQGKIDVNIDGLVKITGTTTVDATSNLASTGSNNTAFTMDGGRLIIRTGGTQPNMQGNYNLTGGVVEFASTSATNIRTSSPPNQYYNVDVSGTNVKSGGKKFIVNNLLKLTTATAVLNIPDETDGNNPYVVTAKKGLQVVTDAVFHLGNNANLMQDDDAVNSGNILVDRIAILPNNGYNYWAAPVSGQPLLGNTFSPGTPDNRIFDYRESNDRFYGTGDTTFQIGKGYAIKGGTADDGTTPHRFNFKGVPNNGNLFTSTLNCTSCSSTNKDHGYNLIGNPYPSNLDFDLFWSSNQSSMYSTAYFWTNNTYTANQQGSNYSGANYAIYNGTGGNPAAYQGTSAGPTPTSSIKPGQGFIIQMKQAASLNFNNTMRNPAQSVFFNNKFTSEKDRFHLTLTSPSNISNVLLIGYVPGATDNYEGDFDADLIVEGSDSFYSKLGNSKLAIQGRNYPLLTTDVVPLGAVYYQTGSYKISLSDSEGIFKTEQDIYLKDKVLNQTINLSKQDYTFSAVKGTVDNRFEIIYKPEEVLSTGDVKQDHLKIYRDANDFVIKTSQKINELNLYDASARLIFTSNPDSVETKIDGNRLLNGVFVLKIKLISGEIITRKIRK